MFSMKKLLILLLAWTLASPALARPLLVAAASDLGYCIDELVAAYRKTAPDAEPKVSLGASGNFFAQIRNGAPFEVFLSADMDYPRQLIALGAATSRHAPFELYNAARPVCPTAATAIIRGSFRNASSFALPIPG